MRCRLMRRLFFVIAVLLLFAGCSDAVEEHDLAGKHYIYEKEGFGGDFSITLNEDGTFSYYEGMLSSYIGFGTWTLEGDLLRLADDEALGYPFVNCFRVSGNDLIFLSERSSNFLYVKVADGERFSGRPSDTQ